MRHQSGWFYLSVFFVLLFTLGLFAWTYDEISYGGQPWWHPFEFGMWIGLNLYWAKRWHR